MVPIDCNEKTLASSDQSSFIALVQYPFEFGTRSPVRMGPIGSGELEKIL